MDSFYEYLLKSYILFGEKEDYRMFQAAYGSIQNHLRRGSVLDAILSRGGGPPVVDLGCFYIQRKMLFLVLPYSVFPHARSPLSCFPYAGGSPVTRAKATPRSTSM